MRIRFPALILLLTLVLSACGQPAAQPTPTPKPAPPAVKPITIALTTDATTLDPAYTTVSNENTLYYYLFDTLLCRAPDGKLELSLAESYKALDDKTWEFKLRKDVKYHNGEPFNAECVKFTFDRMLDPAEKCPSAGHYSTVKEVKVVDEYTVQIITGAPDPLIPARLKSLSIVPVKYVKEKGKAYFARNPIGTGAYVFKEWVKDSHITMEANPNYFKGVPQYPKVVFKPIPEYATRVSVLRTGEVDVITNIIPGQADTLAKEPNIVIHKSPTLRTMMLLMRPDLGPLKKKEVRQAINYAIDKESIVKNVLGGYAQVAKGQVLGPMYFGYNPNLQAYSYDLDKAKKLLSSAGYPNGFEIDLYTPAGRYTLDKEIAEAISAQLAKVGIKAKIQPFEWGLYSKLQQEKKFGHLNLFAFMQTTYDAEGILYSLFFKDQIWGVGPYWSNPEVDRLTLLARGTVDPKVREDSFQKALAIIREEAPVVFLHHMMEVYGVKKGIDFTPRPDEILDVFTAGLKKK